MNRSKVNLLDLYTSGLFCYTDTNSHRVNIRGDKYAMMLLAEVAEQAKVELSALSSFHRSYVLVILAYLFVAWSLRG
jgi:hypothetical protein